MRSVRLDGPDGKARDSTSFEVPEEGGYLWAMTQGPIDGALLDRLPIPDRFHPFVTSAPHHPTHAFAPKVVATNLFSLAEDFPPFKTTAFTLLVAERWLLLVAWGEIDLFEGVWAERHTLIHQGTDMILGALLAPLLDRYSQVVDHLVHRADVVDELALRGAPRLYKDIHRVRKEALVLRRLLQPEVDAMAVLKDHPRPGGDTPGAPYVQDLLQRLRRVAAEVDGVRDGMMAVVESYSSVVANRMNRVMKTLTVVSVVFLPATLIASIYGMNFKMPEYHWKLGYPYAVALMAALSIGILVYMRVKHWFA